MDRLACLDLHAPGLEAPYRADMVAMLRQFSPHVETKADEGIFWLDGKGIEAIFGSHRQWGSRIFDAVSGQGEGEGAAVVVGFSRFAVAAIARCSQGVVYIEAPEVEASRMARMPLRYLGLPPDILDALTKLGIRRVAELGTLPPDGLLARFGKEAKTLLDLVTGQRWDPLRPTPEVLPITATEHFDYPESNATRLLFAAKHLLRPLLRRVRRRRQVLAALEMRLDLDRFAPAVSRLEPAAPTLDEVQVADLIRLRLESTDLNAGVVGMTLTAKTAVASKEQLALFRTKNRRDLRAADRALARLRAEFGTEAVTHAVLRQAHLPEARFALVPLTSMRLPRLDDTAAPFPTPHFRGQLIRRIYARPIALKICPVVGPRECRRLGMQDAPATQIHGPFILSGGWWATPVHREYYFTESETGEIGWVFYDKKRRKWFLHGRVE